MRLSIDPVGHLLVVSLLAGLLLGALLVGPDRTRLNSRRRRLLAGLRLAVVLLIVAAMLRPTLVYTQVRKQSASLVLLVDRSRSMAVADMAGNRSRWDALTAALDDSRAELERLASDLKVECFAFDAAISPRDVHGGLPLLEEQPDGVETAIGAALEQVLQRQAGQRLAGVVLLSDGAQRASAANDVAPQTPVRQMADLGQPLYTVTFGQARGPDDARDVALSELALSESAVYVKNEFSARAAAASRGYPNQRVSLRLRFESPSSGKMEVVDSTAFSTGTAGQSTPVELRYAPPTPGEYKVTLETDALPGELVLSNNQLSTFLTVRKGGLSVLYLEGAVGRVEKRFLRAALDSANLIGLDYQYLDAQRVRSQPPDLSDRFRPGRYDVYIFGDVDSSAFRQDDLLALAESIDAGAGLMMLGGLHSFGPGGYATSPLADVLPIEMQPFERQAFGDVVSSDLHYVGQLRMRPTAEGQRHFVTALAAGDANSRHWEALPPLDGANRFRGLKPRATTLVESENQQPLLVAHDVGRGRVMAFAGDSTWHWVLEGHAEDHQRFWRQVVLWLAHKEQSTEGEIWIALDPRRYSPGRRVEFTAGANSADGEPLAGATLAAEVTLPDGAKRPARLQRSGAKFAGTFAETLVPGDYTLTITATREGKALGTARARFLVYEQDLELENPAADPSLLASLAATTGGQSVPPEQLPSLLRRIAERPMNLEVSTETKQPLWDNWPLLIVFAGLLSTEWVLRKRWGLV